MNRQLDMANRTMAGAGKTFYQAARLLPATVRSDVVALYAFCRTIDDLADEPVLPVAERCVKLSNIADAFVRECEPDMRAAGWPFPCTGRMPRTALLLVQAAMDDLQPRQPAEDETLLAYAFGVAGTVGILMAEVLQAQPEGYGAAVALGLAMQLSNICRDVAQDLREGRVYLPANWVSAETLRHALENQDRQAAVAVRQATLNLLQMADVLYRVAFGGLWTLPWRIRWSILAAALCYREIGVVVGKDVERSWHTRAVVSRRRKLQLITKAALLLLHPRMWRRRPASAWPSVLGAEALHQCSRLSLAS